MSHFYKDGVLVPADTPGALVSPTTIISRVLRKPGLEEWRDRVGPEAADKHRDARADLGTRVHKHIEVLLGGGVLPTIQDDILPFTQGFHNWASKFKPSDLTSELYMESKEGYAGRCDLVCRIEGELYIVDFKTGKAQPEHRLQLAAYQLAFSENSKTILGTTSLGKYEVPKRAVLQVTDSIKRGYRFHPYSTTEDARDLEAFLALKKTYDWLQLVEKPRYKPKPDVFAEWLASTEIGLTVP